MFSSSAVVQEISCLGLPPLPVISFTLDQRSLVSLIGLAGEKIDTFFSNNQFQYSL